ncbi:alginate export family protein [Bacteroides sp. GM023]|uniref:alginate export family protein n=1 Tax=Bacteroides sp. GM023 TaxID=2723058 RepID=UPI00168A7384|nr:alginate export family protein [Bacteroides sp. GM023]MBD3588203.1 alginate export family protein [Bacteroides sp. GM023]
MKTFYWSLVIMLLPSMAYTQNTEKENEFTMSVQIRPRAEYRNGALTPRNEGESAASFINNRARLSMDYKRSDLEIKMSAQHVGVWGQDPQIDKNGRFILNEAWAKLDFGQGFFAQLGRQTLSYDDERILGGLDWNVAGRYHDALKLGYANKNNEVHLILAFNQNDEKTAGGTYYDSSKGQPYKNMQTVWYHYKSDNIPFGASLLFMNLGLETGDKATEDSHTRYLQTMGTYLTYKDSGWDLNGAFYYQMGKNKFARKVSALMGSVQAAYAFDKTWGVVASFDYLSGDKGTGDKFKAFDPLYGTHHKFYGAMDYFYASTFANGYAPGLMDARIGGRFRASSKVDMELNYHYFTTAVKLPELKKSLGSEVDYQINWSIMKDVKLSAGYSFMLGTKTMDAVKTGNHKSWQDWGWVSLNINPKVLFTKW